MILILLGVVLYLVIAAITGGVIHAIKGGKRWGTIESGYVGILWPFSWIWYGIFKPIIKASMRLTQWQLDKRRLRLRLREEKQQEDRKRIAEVDMMMAQEEEERQRLVPHDLL